MKIGPVRVALFSAETDVHDETNGSFGNLA